MRSSTARTGRSSPAAGAPGWRGGPDRDAGPQPRSSARARGGGGVSLRRSFDHDLDLPALRRLVDRIAADPASWRDLVNLDTEHRHYAQLCRDDHLDVWVISWMNGHDTGFHDHDLSRGAVAIVEGELVEEQLTIGGPPAALPRRR